MDDKEIQLLQQQFLELFNAAGYRSAASGSAYATSHKSTGKFREPTSERWIEHHRRYRPEGFYRLFCAHDRPRWERCGVCKRGQQEANSNLAKLLQGKQL